MTLPSLFTFVDGTGFHSLSTAAGTPWTSVVPWEAVYMNSGPTSEGEIGNSGTGSFWLWTADSFEDDHSSQLESINGLPMDTTGAIGLICRFQDPINDINIWNGQGTHYLCTFLNDDVVIEKNISGSYSTLIDTPTGHGQVVSGDVLKFSAVGNTLTAYINGTQVAQTTDSSLPSGGRAGMGGWGTAHVYIRDAVMDNEGAPPPPDDDFTGAFDSSLAVRGVVAGVKVTNPTLPAQDPFNTGPSTLTDPPWKQINGSFFISQALGEDEEWAAAGLSSGGFSTVGADFFIDTAGTLIGEHTSTTGGHWFLATSDPEDLGNATVNASGQAAAGNSGDSRYHYEPGPTGAAYRVLCDVTYVSNQGNKAGLRIHDQDTGFLSDCFEVMFEQDNSTWTLQRWGGGQTTLDTYVDSGFTTSVTRSLQLEIDGSGNISVYIDDVLRLSATDTSFPDPGFAGMLLGAGAPNGLVIDSFLVQEGSAGAVGGGADSMYIWDDDEFEPDQYAQLTMRSTPWADQSQFIMLMVRVDPLTTSFYSDGTGYILYSDGGSATYLQKWIAGTPTELERDDGITWDAGDVLKLQVVDDEITFYINGVSELTATDSSIVSGQVGIGGFNTSELLYFDDFEGDIAGGSIIELSGAFVGRAGAKPTIVTRKQASNTDAVKSGARATTSVANKAAKAAPTAVSGARATCAGIKTVATGTATASTGAKAVQAGQSSKSFLAFTGARGTVAGVRPVTGAFVSSLAVRATSTTTGKVGVATLVGSIGARAQVNPFSGIGSIVLSQTTVIYVPAPFTYNITITGTGTNWTEDTSWTITPASGGPSLASSSVIVSNGQLATWVFTLGPGTGSFTISDGVNNAILVVLPASFSIVPSTKTWVPTADLVFALIGAGTAWTEDTTWTITPSGGVSLAASQIITTDTTHATWTLTLGPGTDGTFTLSDGTNSQVLTITSGVVSLASTGPRGINSGRKTITHDIVGRDGLRATVASLLVGTNTVTTRTGLRAVNAKVKAGIAAATVKFGARAQNVIVQIRNIVTFGRAGLRSTSVTVKQGKAQPTTRTAVRGTNQYLKTGQFAPQEHIGARATTAGNSSATDTAFTASAGSTATDSGRGQFQSATTGHLAVTGLTTGTPVTARSMFGSVGASAQTTGIKGGQATPVASISARQQCSGAKLGVQSPTSGRSGLGTSGIGLKGGLAQPTVRTGGSSLIDAPQAHGKPTEGHTGAVGHTVIAATKRAVQHTGKAGMVSRTQGIPSADKAFSGRFGGRARTTALATVGPVVPAIPATYSSTEQAMATYEAKEVIVR